jgi:hypothetical protein
MQRAHRPQSRRRVEGPQPPPRPDPKGGPLRPRPVLPRGRPSVLFGRTRPAVRKTGLRTRTALRVTNPRLPKQAPRGRAPDSPTARPQAGTLTAQTSLFPRGRSSVLVGWARPIVRNTASGRQNISHAKNPRITEQARHGRVPDSPTVRLQGGTLTLTVQTSLFPPGPVFLPRGMSPADCTEHGLRAEDAFARREPTGTTATWKCRRLAFGQAPRDGPYGPDLHLLPRPVFCPHRMSPADCTKHGLRAEDCLAC